MAPPIVIFSITGCRHCKAAKALLTSKGIAFHDVNLDSYPQRRPEAIAMSGGRKTVPQIFFGARHIGGNSELQALNEEGKLDTAVAALEHEVDDPSKRPATPAEYTAVHGTEEEEDGAEETKLSPEDEAREKKRVKTEAFVAQLRKGLEIKDRRYKLRTYHTCFVASEAVDFLVETQKLSRIEAVGKLAPICKRGIIHHVTNDHAFKDEYLFFRFQEDERTTVLNITRKFEGKPRPAPAVADDVRRQILELYNEFLSTDGNAVDYDGIATSELFKRYVTTTTELQGVDLSELTHNERLAFFINVYNALVIHGNVVLGKPKTMWRRMAFFSNVAYNIGGHKFSLNDIEQGILRRNRKGPASVFRNFGKNDPRKAFMLETRDPRIHFALVCGAKSCPPIKLYQPSDVQDTLTLATEAFVEDDSNYLIDEAAQTVTLSKIFGWYRSDFGPGSQDVLYWSLSYLPSAKRKLLQRMLGINDTGAATGGGGGASAATAATGAGTGAGAAPGASGGGGSWNCAAGDKKVKIKFFDYNWGVNEGSSKGKK